MRQGRIVEKKIVARRMLTVLGGGTLCGSKYIHLNCLVVVLSIAVASPVTAELVAHWKFDEGSGNTAHDASGNGNGGTFVGNPQ